jgi:hypothetical protein
MRSRWRGFDSRTTVRSRSALIETVDGDPAWVIDKISTALDDIVDDFDDMGPKFWDG